MVGSTERISKSDLFLHPAYIFKTFTPYAAYTESTQPVEEWLMNRRKFLKAMALGASVPIQAGAIGHVLATAPPGTFAPVSPAGRDPVAHVISRLTYGVTPALYAHVRNIGIDAFIEEQLGLDSPEDLESRRSVGTLSKDAGHKCGSTLRPLPEHAQAGGRGPDWRYGLARGLFTTAAL